MKTYVILDSGNTHCGDLLTMKTLIEAAKQAGADAVKFQWTSDPDALAARRNAQDYRNAYQALAFPREWLSALRSCAARYGLDFMCTVYLADDLFAITPLVTAFKIASFEASDKAFFAQHLWYRKPIYVSLGMADEAETLWYLARREHLKNAGSELRLLHCVSSYPAPLAELNLGAIRAYGLDGFSDHSRCQWTGALAVAAGARVIETHLRLDDCDPACEDYAHSFPPTEAKAYVERIRLVEQAMGDGVKRPTPSEGAMYGYRVSNRATA